MSEAPISKGAETDAVAWNVPVGAFGVVARWISNVCGLAAVLVFLPAIYFAESGFQMRVAEGIHAHTIRGKDLALGLGAIFITFIVVVITSNMLGQLRKRAQIRRFPKATAQVLREEMNAVSPADADGASVVWAPTLVCAYPWNEARVEGRVRVSPMTWPTREAAREYVTERVSDGRCAVAINPEKPEEAFLLPAAPRGTFLLFFMMAVMWGMVAIFWTAAHSQRSIEQLTLAAKHWTGSASVR